MTYSIPEIRSRDISGITILETATLSAVLDDLEAAQAEIARLREAMREIVSQAHNLTRTATADRIEQIASAALKGGRP